MAGPVLYSTNPWIASEIASKYRGGVHFVWCSEYFDPSLAPPGSAAALVAPSSSPQGIYDTLWDDCTREDGHSALIKGYKRTFKRLAAEWFADGSITAGQRDEIVATVTSRSWKIWRPMLYVIGVGAVGPARILAVPRRARAAYGPELQIVDLQRHEFDCIETKK